MYTAQSISHKMCTRFCCVLYFFPNILLPIFIGVAAFTCIGVLLWLHSNGNGDILEAMSKFGLYKTYSRTIKCQQHFACYGKCKTCTRFKLMTCLSRLFSQFTYWCLTTCPLFSKCICHQTIRKRSPQRFLPTNQLIRRRYDFPSMASKTLNINIHVIQLRYYDD